MAREGLAKDASRENAGKERERERGECVPCFGACLPAVKETSRRKEERERERETNRHQSKDSWPVFARCLYQ